METCDVSSKESLVAWEANADFWDKRMGDESNAFHREIVRPYTDRLMDVQPGDFVLDVACGNGNYSKHLAEQGVRVVAFDYSEKMIKNAKRRQSRYSDLIEFHSCDATDYQQILSLRKEKPFDKAVANMAVMDISLLPPLFRAVYELLKNGGVFVFSLNHPCFIRPSGDYLEACAYKGEAIVGQPVQQYYFHRSLQELFNCCFSCGFVIDGYFEEVIDGSETPIIVIIRLKKQI